MTFTPPAEQCLDEAGFDSDVTIPDNTLMEKGQTFTKTWRVRNTGTCAWVGYSLVYAGGELMSAPLVNALPVVQPGEYVDVTVVMVAPGNGGQYSSDWTFQNAQGETFGVGEGGHDFIWVVIMVDWGMPVPTEAPGDPGGGDGDCGISRDLGYESQVLDLMNSARTSNGLGTLSLSPQLTNAAVAHSTDMACADFVGHTGSDGSDWYDRVAAQGFSNWASARESIYVGDPSFGGMPDGAFDWWMNSPVHRDNILFADVSEVGIGYVYYAGSSYGGYYTVVFARP
jgi:uncharacterized protein YkwD